jgi:hypothetical protein
MPRLTDSMTGKKNGRGSEKTRMQKCYFSSLSRAHAAICVGGSGTKRGPAVIQGGYALASVQASPEPFHRAIRGDFSLLHNESDKQ